LLLISSMAGLLMLYLFEKLALLDLDLKTARVATILLVTFPIAFILFAPYTESLFLLCAIGCIYFARTRKWILAGVSGALATLTRQQGLFLVFPLAWELWDASGPDLKAIVKTWQGWLALIGPPAGYAAWFVYRTIYLNDFPVNSGNFTSLVYSIMISSSRNKVVADYYFTWPWQAMWIALKHFKLSDTDLLIDLAVAGAFLLLLPLAWRRLCISYRIYVVAITLISFSLYTGPVHPYMGLPRHLLLAFPVFIGAAPKLQTNRRWLIWALAGLPVMMLMIAGYVEHAWVP
jgi:hypothetical protein